MWSTKSPERAVMWLQLAVQYICSVEPKKIANFFLFYFSTKSNKNLFVGDFVTVVLYNKYIKLNCTTLYAQKDALLNDPRHTPTTFYSFSLQYLGVAVCTVPTNCVGGGRGVRKYG